MFNIKIHVIICISLLFISCKTSFEAEEKITNAIPKTYEGNPQSDKVALPNWKIFFADSTLTNLISTSLQNNFEILSALQRIQQYQSEVVLNKGIRLPDLNFNAIAGQTKFGKYTSDGVGNYDTNFSNNITPDQKMSNPLPEYYLGLSTQWEIDIWGKLKNKKRAALARYMASENGKRFIITNVIAEVSNLYYELLALDSESEILQNNIKLQSESLDIVIAQKQAGKANELGIEIMQGRLLSSKSRLIEVEQKIIICENKINFLLGRYPQRIKRSETIISCKLPQKLQEGIPSELLNNRPDIKQAEFELMAAKADVQAAKFAFYPTITLNASIGYQAFNSALLLDPASVSHTLLGGLTAPLLNRRKLKSELLLSKASKQQAYIQYQKTIIKGFTEVYNDLKLLSNNRKMTDLKTEEVAILKTSITTSTELFKNGKANYLEVVNAQKNFLESQIELITLRKNQFQSSIDLYKSLGGGWQ